MTCNQEFKTLLEQQAGNDPDVIEACDFYRQMRDNYEPVDTRTAAAYAISGREHGTIEEHADAIERVASLAGLVLHGVLSE